MCPNTISSSLNLAPKFKEEKVKEEVKKEKIIILNKLPFSRECKKCYGAGSYSHVDSSMFHSIKKCPICNK